MMCHWLFSIILIHIYIAPCLSINNGYFSMCDVVPESTKWIRNNGKILESWISSVIPSSGSSQNETFTLAGFESNDRFSKVLEIMSLYGVLWQKYGDGIHDGWLYGITDLKTGEFIKKKTYYIYPNYMTAIQGTFRGDMLRGGKETKATHFRCRGGIMELKFAKLKKNSTLYKYTKRTESFISRHPTQRDPLEMRNVYIGSSPTFPNIAHQDALLAKRNIPAHSLIVYYSGTWKETRGMPNNMTRDDLESYLKNLIKFNSTHHIDVDVENSDIKVYRATLGHKVNHHFVGVNAKFCKVKHPVYGTIRCLESIKPIWRHDEILVNYSYDIQDPFTPRWYKDLYYQQNQG
ncbi:histone-lysine N-methyltransferase SETD7 [Lepeophtheirus salmonis]|uniref:histone-lysine N-methyltransferase SETD7 n=1 Tax=Lepeophtheirus salmonis TaxID=72036 RepID=UPI001AE4C365|nr:histone-lysine N-methyltransferase SETD7-like isoform X1 [Lepeophtheirus salmonis]